MITGRSRVRGILFFVVTGASFLAAACSSGSSGTNGGSGATGASAGTAGATGTTGTAGTAAGATGTTGTAGTTGTTGTSGASGLDGGPVLDASATSDASGASADGGCSALGSKLQYPNPIISRGAQVFSSPANGAAVVDGQYHNGGWTAGLPTTSAPAWVAIKLPVGPSRLLVSWDDGGTYNYEEALSPVDPAGSTVYGLPGDYHIDTSADSTNGTDGTWTTQVTVSANLVRTRAHSFPFAGQSWVKMVITAAPATISTNGVQIGEIDVHDISTAGSCLPQDTWFFMGDSITAFAYDRAAIHQPSFAAGIHTASPTFFPAMINGGIGGETSTNALARLPQTLDLNPDYRFFTLAYGTNDAGYQIGTSLFQSNMQAMITMLKGAGRTPVIPHIPYSANATYTTIPAYNTIIDTLVQSNGLMAAPDFYGFFMQNTADFVCGCAGGRTTDNLHPNDVGLAAMNALWTQAMTPLYP